MTEQNVIALSEQLISLGLGERAGELYMNRNNPEKQFSIVWNAQNDDDLLQYFLRFERDATNSVRLKEYELTIRNVPVPPAYISLNEELMKADAMTNAYYAGNEREGDQEFCESVEMKLKELHRSDPEAAAIFMFKYWPQSLYKEFIPDDSSLKQRYEVTLWVEANADNTMTATEAYQYLKQMNKEHVIADELLTIAKNEMQNGNHFIAYNEISYFLDKPDMYFFKTKEEADEFSDNNISEYDNFKVIHARSVDELLSSVPYGEQLRILLLTNKNELTMNEQNLAALEKKLLNLGFGEGFNEAMKKNITEQKPEFNLTDEIQYGGRSMLVDLSFRAGKENEMYFFNSYQATLRDDPEKSQRFYLDKGNGVTTKEAFNLLEGRAVNKDLVNKEGMDYNAWVQLNFEKKLDNGNFDLQRYHSNYNFDLTKTMNEFILKPLELEQDNALHNSLMKGNVQSVSFLKDGEEVKGFIEANPKDRTLNVYDGHMKPLTKEQKEELMDIPAPKAKQQKQSTKAGDDGGDDIELKKKRTRKQGNGVKM